MAIKKQKLIDKQMLKAYRIARPRLLKVWPKLKEKGWTRDDLFRIGKFGYPLGPWGIAWSPVWLIPGMKAYIREDGVIEFKWQENGWVVTQTARPEFSQQKKKE